MADKKIYYYLKLKEGFFDSEDMLLLQGMKDGYIYSDHRSWEDNASKGNSYKLTQRTKTYLKELRKDG